MAQKPKQTTDEHDQVRDRRGEWRSGRPVFEEPVFMLPPQPVAFVKWLVGWSGYLFPWNAFYVAVTLIVYLYFTPSLERMQTFGADWIAEILLRNVILLTVIAGALHLWLWAFRGQGRRYKYNGRWMAKEDSTFLFRNQV